MNKAECIEKKLICDLRQAGECLIREHTLKITVNGTERNVVCSPCDLDELVRGFCHTESTNRREKVIPLGWEPQQVFKLVKAFQGHEGIHSFTAASHMAILSNGDEILSVMEDISRHCAIDKVIGYALINDIDLTKCMIFSSGRVQYDTVRKLANAKVPVLISKSAPTFEAVELAKETGITLIGKAWPDGYTVYFDGAVK